jgi:catechol 2,3-dioxygenase-like lactoylglutathione lyase family enzyme
MTKFNKLIPEIIVSNLEASLKFYCKILGFDIEYERPENGFAFISYQGSQLMLEQDLLRSSPWRVEPLEQPYGRGMNLSIESPDVVRLATALGNSGHTLRKPIEECWYRKDSIFVGESNFLVLDPDGYLLRFSQDLGSKPAIRDEF